MRPQASTRADRRRTRARAPGAARAPAAPRPPLRRRAHSVLPVLLAARRRRAAPAGALSARRRLARGVEPLLLARLPRPSGGHAWLPGADALHAPAPARLLLLTS